MPDPKAMIGQTARRVLPPGARSKATKAVRMATGRGQQASEPFTLWRARLAEQVAVSGDTPVAFVGCGLQARNLAGALHAAGGRVAAACDARPGVAESFVDDFGPGGLVHSSYDELLAARDDWSVLVVATTAGSHLELATTALDAGVDRLLVEKPVATSVADARTLADRATAAGATVAVNHTRRWLPSSVGLRRLIRSGVIGDVKALNFMWGRNGFAMIGTHLFDFARLLTGADIAEVRCTLATERRVTWRGDEFVDQPGFATATMTDGTRVTIDLSSDLDTQQGYLVIVGSVGRIEVDEMLGKVRMVGRGRRVWEAPYGFADCLAVGGAKAIVDLEQGVAPACTVADGLAALEAVIGCQLSDRAGGDAVELPLGQEQAAEVFPFA